MMDEEKYRLKRYSGKSILDYNIQAEVIVRSGQKNFGYDYLGKSFFNVNYLRKYQSHRFG